MTNIHTRVNFRKSCPSKSLAFEIPKKARSSSFVTSLRYVYLSFVELIKYLSKCSKSVCSSSFLPRVSIIESYHGLHENKAIETHVAENIRWPTSTLKYRANFRKSCPGKSLAYEIPKGGRSSSFVTSLRYVYLSLLRTSSGSFFDLRHNFLISVIQNRCNNIICKKVCPYVNGLFFIAHSLLWYRA